LLKVGLSFVSDLARVIDFGFPFSFGLLSLNI
jgi:hypothetical protein